MKGIGRILILWIVPLGAVFFSCEEQRITYNGPDYVRFTDSSLVYKESYGKLLPIGVHIVGTARNQPVTVNYSLRGTAIEGRDYTVEGGRGSVTIPADSHFGFINLNIINNANNILRSQEVIFTLISATSGDGQPLQIGTGKNYTLGNSLRLVIEDDCLFGGYYTGKRAGYTGQVKDVAITSTNCTDYLLTNWNIGILNFNADKLTLQFTDNGDNSITIPSQYNGFLGDTLLGNGAWDPRTKEILLNVSIKYKTASGVDTVAVIPQLSFLPR